MQIGDIDFPSGDVLVSVSQGVDTIIQEVPLIVECTETNFVDLPCLNFVINRTESMKLGCGALFGEEGLEEGLVTNMFLHIRFRDTLQSCLCWFLLPNIQAVHFTAEADELFRSDFCCLTLEFPDHPVVVHGKQSVVMGEVGGVKFFHVEGHVIVQIFCLDVVSQESVLVNNSLALSDP